jgi:hypothetical protein
MNEENRTLRPRRSAFRSPGSILQASTGPETPGLESEPDLAVYDAQGFLISDGGVYRWLRAYNGAFGVESRTLYIRNNSDADIAFQAIPYSTASYSDSFFSLYTNYVDLPASDVIKPKETREILIEFNYFANPGTRTSGTASLTLHSSDPSVGDYNIDLVGVLASL